MKEERSVGTDPIEGRFINYQHFVGASQRNIICAVVFAYITSLAALEEFLWNLLKLNADQGG